MNTHTVSVCCDEVTPGVSAQISERSSSPCLSLAPVPSLHQLEVCQLLVLCVFLQTLKESLCI